MNTRSRSALLAVLAGVFLVLAGTAHADPLTRSDGNDTRGPLDIRRAAHGHAGTAVTHTIRTFGPWSKALLGPQTPNAFFLVVSTDGDAAAERIVLIFSSGGRMVALVLRPNGTLVGRASASKPDARAVRVSIPRARLGSPAGYRWQAFSYFEGRLTCRSGCVDRVPNAAARVLHDITPPAISFPALGVPGATTYDVPFSVSDTGGAGLQTWRLEHRPLGTSTWSTVDSGTTVGPQTYQHASAEDADDEFRVVAVDRQGNTRVSPVQLVSVPVDDDALTYAGTWTPGGTLDDFLGTLRTTSDPAATASYNFNGGYVAWIAPGGAGLAEVTVDGTTTVEVDLADFSGSRRVVFEHTFASVEPHTLLIEVLATPVSVDGIVVR
jgi:hypothetical protein